MKTKKKKDPEFDRSTAKWRLPEDIVSQLIKLKLQSPACTNKGFILEGYPRNFQNCLEVFGTKRQFPVDEEGNENREGYVESKDSIGGFDVDSALLPQYVVEL